MAGKTLSNGTLALRFMQNAARAKQLAAAELEQAQVRDEAEWEVSKEVRDAWGLDSARSGPSITYENSYLPFMSRSHDDDDAAGPSSAGLKGRRSYNSRGEETKAAEIPPVLEAKAAVESEDWSKKSKRPATISGSGGTVFLERKGDPKTKKASSTQAYGMSARSVIREITDVGSDLSAERKRRRVSATNRDAEASSGFQKPGGVDEPVAARPASATMFLKPAGVDDAVDGQPRGKSKRPLDGSPDDAIVKKKKKKKGKEVDLSNE